MSKKIQQLQSVHVDDPRLQQFLDAVKNNMDLMLGEHSVEDKRPSVQDMIDAGVPNADEIT